MNLAKGKSVTLNSRRRWKISSVALSMLLVFGLTSGVSAQGAESKASVVWAPCEGAPSSPPRECTVVNVPLDYADGGRGQTPLQVARVKASGTPAQYKGTLVFLPGGPPSAGVNYVGYTPNLDRSVAPEIQAAYDLVGIQQIGSWDGVACLSGAPLKEYWETNHLPKTATELAKVAGLEKQFNQGCVSSANPLVPFMNTARSIKDIESVRRALGVDRVSLLAFSYGTALAHGYMAQFPTSVGRAVLDSVVDRSTPDPIHDAENNVAYDKSWMLFKQWCQSDTTCSLKGQNLDQLFDGVVEKAATVGIPAPRNPFGGRLLNDWEFTVGMEALTGAGEATRVWAATVLSEAASGDGSQSQFLYDLLTGRRADGSYLGGDGTRRAFSCNDTVWSQLFRTPEDIKKYAQATQLIAPRYGAASVFQGYAQCYGWPLEPVSPAPHEERVPSGIGALLVNADNDASTPLIWAKRVQQRIPGSRLVVVTGATHLQIPHSRCATNFALKYLVDGTLPQDGVRCGYDPDLNPPQLPPDLGSGAISAKQGVTAETLERLKGMSTR